MQIFALFLRCALGSCGWGFVTESKFVFANLCLDGCLNILKGLQGGFTRDGIGNLFRTLNDFLIEHCLLFSHRHLSGTELDCNAREF